jgi:hypothetical protein
MKLGSFRRAGLLPGRLVLCGLVAWAVTALGDAAPAQGQEEKGKVYQKDLGKKTEVGAAAIQDYDPDSSWTEAKE